MQFNTPWAAKAQKGTTYLILEDVHHELDRGEIGREGESVRHKFKQCNPSGPNI